MAYKPAGSLGRGITLAGIVLASCALVGCSENHHQAGTSGGRPTVGAFQDNDENPFLNRGKPESAKNQQVVTLTIYPITANTQKDISLEELWSLLRPVRLAKGSSQLLTRNGLQISAGGAADWPKVVDLLGLGSSQKGQEPISTAKPAAKYGGEMQTWLSEGLVAELPISPSPSEQTLFLHQADGQLVGKTYEDCYKLLTVRAAVQTTGQVLLEMVPALKNQRARLRSLRWMVDSNVTGKPEMYVAKFEPLALIAAVNPNEFLVVGRTSQISDAGFGGVFFRADHLPQPATTILLIVPRRVTHVPGKGFVEPEDVMQIGPTKHDAE